MKLILSRKGFDTENGRCPSPIFPNGKLCSLPIPDCDSNIRYDDIRYGDMNIGEIVENLTRRRQPQNRIAPESRAHLDPDINYEAYPREKGWQPLFGQGKGHQTHLSDQGVQIGDLFLFFGLFQKVKKTSGKWCFVKDASRQHILWGWLQIGEIHKVNELTQDQLSWTRYHPHLQYLQYPEPYPNNTLYIASEVLDLGNGPIKPGAGLFPNFHERLVLTDPEGSEVTDWRLPRCFYPDESKCPLTHFPDLNNNWNQNDKYAYACRKGPGQEFVLDLDQYPDVTDWLVQSIFTHDC